MNFYDKVYEMVNSFKSTNEFKEYLEIKNKVKADPEIYKKLQEFKKEQEQNQLNYLNNNGMDQEKQKQIQNMYVELIKNPDVKKFFDCEIKLDVMLGDMQKIIGDGIKELIEF